MRNASQFQFLYLYLCLFLDALCQQRRKPFKGIPLTELRSEVHCKIMIIAIMCLLNMNFEPGRAQPRAVEQPGSLAAWQPRKGQLTCGLDS